MTKSILIVEDENDLRDAYTLLFEMKKYTVFSAVNGKEALSILKNKKPDYIILDILMPVMGGIEFLETAHIPEEYPGTKVLVLSNLSDRKTITKVMNLGASRYILKASSSPSELLQAIESL
jgi:DNA-binding NarL/FixJ family response regulator